MSHDQYRQHGVEPDDLDQVSLPSVVADIGNGWEMAETVETDGTVALWLLAPDGDDGTHGCACPDCAPHEVLNRKCLPTICGAPTKATGQPCQVRVRVGARCSAHSTDSASQQQQQHPYREDQHR